jgi:hypothetical protein
MCLRGVSEVNAAITQNASPKLSGYVVWVPVLGGKETDVAEATKTATDTRVRHFWDGDGRLVKELVPVLGLPDRAWDVYLVYDSGARWDATTPPSPAFWMHQLRGEVKGPRLDAAVFRQRLNEIVGAGAR